MTILGRTKYTEFASIEKFGRNSEIGLVVHDCQLGDQRARFAMALLEKWALVAGAPNGEDKSGRQAWTNRAADEVAKYACDISEFAFAEFESRGWMADIGSYDRLTEMEGKD